MEISYELMEDALQFNQYTLPCGTLHWHENIEICYMLRGTADFTVGNETYRFTPGDIVTVPSRELHLFEDHGDNLVNICLIPVRDLTFWIHDLPFLPTFISHEQIEQIDGVKDQLESIFAVMKSEKGSNKPFSTQIMLTQTLHLWCLLARNFKTNSYAVTKHRNLIQPILDQITQDCSKPYSLKLLASQLNYTPEYLSSIFHECVGMGFKEYLDNRRINLAKNMLLSHEFSIYEIAQQCGFENIRTFNNRFKKLVNMTPSEYIYRFSSSYNKNVRYQGESLENN